MIIDKNKETDPVLSKIQFIKQSDLLNVVNGSYIARRFFNKSRAWFSQRLNNHIVNGTPVEFTQKETETLRNALYTLSIELADLADGMQ